MSHKHHNCSCNHENVKYCKTCRVVHCLDCNQEWGKTVTQWYPYYSGQYTYPNTWISTTTTKDNIIQANTAACEHAWSSTPQK